MGKKYCAFWYPTIHHRDLVFREGILRDEDIHDAQRKHDDRKVEKHSLSVRQFNNGCLGIISERENHPPLRVLLIRLDSHRNGFVLYEFDDTDIPDYPQFEKLLRKNVYHLSKGFHHEHEVIGDRDGTLLAVVKDDLSEKLGDDDNCFLIEFLKQYADEVFDTYAHSVSNYNHLAKFLAENVDSNIDKLKKSYKGSDSRAIQKSLDCACEDLAESCRRVSQMCENALVEYTYCKSLLSSKYNRSFYHNLTLNDDNRKKALNIRNSIRFIENVKHTNQNRVSLLIRSQILLTKRAVDQGEKAGKISILLGLGGVLMALIFGGAMFLPEEKSFQNHWVVIWVALLGIVILFLIFSYLHINCKYRLKTRD